MQLSVARFNTQLNEMGQAMTWARASFCPCRNVLSGSPRPGCPVCTRGVIWAPARPARAGLSGMKVQRAWASFGAYEAGDVVVSVGSDTPLYAAGENDRIVMMDSTEAYDVVLVHDGRDRLPYALLQVDRVFWLTPDGSAIIEGGKPGQGERGLLVWPAGQLEPPAGTQYTIQGRRRPEMFMFSEMAQDRAHFGGLKLPRRLVLRKFDLFIR